MPQKKTAYIPDPSFRTTAKFRKLKEKDIGPKAQNVMAIYTYPESEKHNFDIHDMPDPAVTFPDAVENEFHRLWIAYTHSGVDNLHAFMRATPEKKLYPIELEALGHTFSSADPYAVIDMLDGKNTNPITGLKTVNEEPLSPCPECKGKAGVFEVFESREAAAWIECLKCKKVATKWFRRKTDHEAVTAATKAWNRHPSRKKKAPKA